MVHPGQVQHAMEHQDAQFIFRTVAMLGGLKGGTVERDSDFASCIRRKGEYVRRVILAAESAVQPAKLAIIRNKAGDAAAAGDFGGYLTQELSQRSAAYASRRMAEQ